MFIFHGFKPFLFILQFDIIHLVNLTNVYTYELRMNRQVLKHQLIRLLFFDFQCFEFNSPETSWKEYQTLFPVAIRIKTFCRTTIHKITYVLIVNHLLYLCCVITAWTSTKHFPVKKDSNSNACHFWAISSFLRCTLTFSLIVYYLSHNCIQRCISMQLSTW